MDLYCIIGYLFMSMLAKGRRLIMSDDQKLVQAIFEGWHSFQGILTKALRLLDDEDLSLRTADSLRTVDEIARHIIGARARWFYLLMGEGGDEFKALGRWDRRDARVRSVEEIISGLEGTWKGMQDAISGWSTEDWQMSWPGEDDSEPEIITRQWVIWHLIEHDLHHGGEISLILGTYGLSGLGL